MSNDVDEYSLGETALLWTELQLQGHCRGHQGRVCQIAPTGVVKSSSFNRRSLVQVPVRISVASGLQTQPRRTRKLKAWFISQIKSRMSHTTRPLSVSDDIPSRRGATRSSATKIEVAPFAEIDETRKKPRHKLVQICGASFASPVFLQQLASICMSFAFGLTPKLRSKSRMC